MTPAPAASTAPHTWLTLAQIQGVFAALGTAVTVVVALGLTYVLLPRAAASVRITIAERRARVAETALAQIGSGLEALSAQVEALTGQVGALRSETTLLRKTQVVSTRYVAQLVLFIRSRKPADAMPPLPDEISDDVLAEIRAHELQQDAAVLGAAGVAASSAP